MLTDKQQKKVFKKEASTNPDKYYPVSVLNEKGFIRNQCKCGTFFWSTDPNRKICGDPGCSGGFNVVENNPSKTKLSFIQVWEKIVEVLEPRGYKPIKRYPVVARWNPTVEFTIASIAAFQPYVITGEVEPPAKKLLIPQFCLRFGDIENVGVTGSHCTGFVMIGQHVFVSPDEWDQAQYFRDIYDFLVDGVGLSKHEFVIHEDAWAGGGSYGPCMEFFSRGVELFNQVYTMFEQTPNGDRELKLKVLDMGAGQERIAWFSQGTPNMYEAIFPLVLKKLREITNIEIDLALYNKFSKFSAYLNVDEVDDIDVAWANVAKEMNMDIDALKEKIWPMVGIYSIAEHSRALLFSITDGKLPSNVGGGYNLRAIFRRAVSFADEFGWDINLSDVCEWHAAELKPIFPSVSEHLDEVRAVLDMEYKKYTATKEKAQKIVKKLLKKENITEELLIQLYDSNGINPEMVIAEAKKMGKKIKKPDDFYNKVVELHEQREQIHQTHKEIEIEVDSDIPETIVDYFDDYLKLSLSTKVQFVQKTIIEDHECWAVITEKTIAYPTSGGQLHDIGTIEGIKFSNVLKFGVYIVHCLDKKPNFKVGDSVTIEIDEDWRRQLAAHHTATHVINAAAREILGEHINQASAKKTYEKAHLDVTHYDSISDDEIKKIEKRANEIINEKIDLTSSLLPRSEAEQKYGMRLYQGGAVPGKFIRIVEIPGEDVEACGGTHMHNTGEIEKIKIIKTQKIQDGVVRITFTGGSAVSKLEETDKTILHELARILGVKDDEVLGRIKELLEKRKSLQKSLIKGIDLEDSLLKLKVKSSSKLSVFEIIDILNGKLNTTTENLLDIVSKQLEDFNRLVKMANNQDSSDSDESVAISKNIKLLIQDLSGFQSKEALLFSQNIIKKKIDTILISISKIPDGLSINGFLGDNLIKSGKINLGKILREFIQKYNGKGGGKSISFQGFLPFSKLIIDSEKIIDETKNLIIEFFKSLFS